MHMALTITSAFTNQPTRDEMSFSHLKELDEDDEVLSFCDIPIYSDASADWGVGSSSSEEGNLFEFFPASSKYQPENIIFCGRMIPYARESSSLSTKKPKMSNKYNHGDGGSQRGPRSMSTSLKACKWYKVMFGFTRLTGQMKMADIKTRQRQGLHRKQPKDMIRMHNEEYDDEPNKLTRRTNAGLIGLVRSLSCRGYCSTRILETSIH